MRYRQGRRALSPERLLRQRAARRRRPLPRDGAALPAPRIRRRRGRRPTARLVAEYPSSSLGEKALFDVGRDRARGRRPQGDRRRGARVPRRLPRRRRARPRSRRALQAGRRAQEAALPTPPPPRPGPGLQPALLERRGSDARRRSTSRRQVHYPVRPHQRPRPPLGGPRGHAPPSEPRRAQRSPSATACSRRSASRRTRTTSVRVVLDFKDVKDHTIFYLENPTRLVVDVRGAAAPPAPVIAGRPRADGRGDRRAAGAVRPAAPTGRDPPRPSAGPARGKPARRRCPCARSPGWSVPRLPPPRRAPTRHPPVAGALRAAPPRRAAAPRPPPPWPSATPAPPRSREARDGPRRRGTRARAAAGQPRRLLQPGPPARPRRAQDRDRRRPRRPRSRDASAAAASRRRTSCSTWPCACERLVRDELGAEVVMTRVHRRLRPARGAHGHRQRAGRRPLPLHPRQQQPQPERARHRDLLPELRPGPARGGGGGARERDLRRPPSRTSRTW